jgi:hypothetical protein
MVRQATKVLVRQATKVFFCTAVWGAALMSCESSSRRNTLPGGQPFAVRQTEYDGRRYLVIEMPDGKRYAVPAESNQDPIRPCNCDLPECRPMCGIPVQPPNDLLPVPYDAGAGSGSSAPR